MKARAIPENAMLVDVQYIKPDWRTKTPDVLYIIWKDPDTLNKYVTTIENPSMDIYFEKPEKRDHSYAKSYVYKTDCNKVTVPYSKMINAIIEDGGEATKARAKAIFASHQHSALDEFLKYPYVYGGDIDVRAYYRYLWKCRYGVCKDTSLRIAFMDIETDFLDVDGVSDPKTCPIDLVTVIDAFERTSYTFALVGRDYDMPDITHMSQKEAARHLERQALHKSRLEQEAAVMERVGELKRELHERFDDSYGSIDYKIYFYNDERKMLTHIFELINRIKFDFVEFWNFEFDVNYIYDRAIALGMDPKSLFCHPDFRIRQCYFKRDNFHFAIKNKTDFFYTSSYTNYICQMRNYAATRKGKSELRSFKLDYVANKELGDKKVDYSEIPGGIKKFSYIDYIKYIIYNIKDVLLQYGIEKATSDTTNYYMTSLNMITPLDGVFKQTVKLRCCQYLFYLDSGKVPGMNINKTPFGQDDEEDDDEEDDITGSKGKFAGALVGDSRLNMNTGVPLYGDKKSNNIFNFGLDMDMGAFYPSTIKITNNEASNLIFKCHVDASQFSVLGGDVPINTISHLPLLPKESSGFVGDVAKECFDNFYTRDYLTAGNKWFNLPDMAKLYSKVERRMS